MGKAEFLHVGLTVSDMKKTIQFYTKYFGFALDITGVFEKDFIESHKDLYGLHNTYSDFCFLNSPNGVVLELFQFHPQIAAESEQWNQPGYTHICLKVENIFKIMEEMEADGVEFFFEPDRRALPVEHWVFLKDPDGNLIELQD